MALSAVVLDNVPYMVPVTPAWFEHVWGAVHQFTSPSTIKLAVEASPIFVDIYFKSQSGKTFITVDASSERGDTMHITVTSIEQISALLRAFGFRPVSERSETNQSKLTCWVCQTKIGMDTKPIAFLPVRGGLEAVHELCYQEAVVKNERMSEFLWKQPW